VSNYGNELIADDVKWGWDRTYALRGVGLWRSRHPGGLPSSDGVEPLDRHTLRFSLPHANPEFPQYLSFPTNLVLDSTEARRHVSADDPWANDWLAQHVAGHGAFAVVRQDDDALGFQARDEYWAGRPGINTILQVAADRREDALRMLEQGEANIALHLYPDELVRFLGRPDYQVFRVRASHALLAFNWHEPPFDNQHVRQAVGYALPHQQIIDQVYRGYARPSRTFLTNVAKYATDDYWPYDTDPGRARELLRSGGYPDGFSTELAIPPSGEGVRFGELVREALGAVGITIDVSVGRPALGGGAPAMQFRQECGHALNEAMYDLAHDFDPPLGIDRGRDERGRQWVDRLRAIRAASAADQPRLYHEIQRDLLEFAPMVPIAEIQTGWVIRGEVDPWVFSPDSLAVISTVWGSHRGDLGVW
jgi:ABC-type transport system substrate-binding protein